MSVASILVGCWRAMLPYYVVHIAVIALVTYVPVVALGLPRAFGF